MTEDPDGPARRALRRHKAIATGLLMMMAGLAAGSYVLPPGIWTSLLRAGAKAGVVGGLADWFAVTALFRHPLGLPIPHTAIIPAEKLRLGQALGRFVSRHVVSETEISRLLETLDVAGVVGSVLADPTTSRQAAEGLAAYLPRILNTVEDGRARRLLARLLPRALGSAAAGRIVARALRTLVEGGRHQEMFSFLLERLKSLLEAKELELRALIEEKVREEGGRLVGWAIGATVATRTITTLRFELEKFGPEGSDMRGAFDEWVRREIARMETDPSRAGEIGAAIRRLVTREAVQLWVWDVWARLRAVVEADAARPASRTVAVLEAAVRNTGAMLVEDEASRARVRRAAERGLRGVLPAAQSRIAAFIADVVASWDTATIVERLELRVGKDLQYVRMNGTLVGFLVGTVLEGIELCL